MSEQKICAITGSNGYVGGCVKNYFASRAWEILELTRSPKPSSRGIPFQLGAEISAAALAGVEVLVHCAYDFTPLTLTEIRAVNVAGTEKLFQAARAAGVKKSSAFRPSARSMVASRFTEKQNLKLKKMHSTTARSSSVRVWFMAMIRAGCSANSRRKCKSYP